MGEGSKIAWTTHTFNPWWGCVRVSPGCTNCYAESFDRRVSGVEKAHWGVDAERREFGDAHWNEPRKWAAAARKAGVRARVFCASMADYLEDHPTADRLRPRLFDLVRETADALDWLLLTKRAERLDLVPMDVRRVAWGLVTAENQEWADRRVPLLLASEGWKVRGVSYEPAIGPVDWYEYPELDWLIVGGESGHGARPFDLAWAHNAIEQGGIARTAVFVKQLGEVVTMADGSPAAAFPRIRGKKWDDPGQWPEDLRVREFPR